VSTDEKADYVLVGTFVPPTFPAVDYFRWAPAIPVRFIERDGVRVLQQAWEEKSPSIGDCGGEYRATGRYEWRDVPSMLDDGPPRADDWWKKK
jgi:hypothetical protein